MIWIQVLYQLTCVVILLTCDCCVTFVREAVCLFLWYGLFSARVVKYYFHNWPWCPRSPCQVGDYILTCSAKAENVWSFTSTTVAGSHDWLIYVLYRMIKKSLCTWWLFCNCQGHRDFLITLYMGSVSIPVDVWQWMSLLFGYEWLNEKNLIETFVVHFIFIVPCIIIFY